MTGPVGMLEAGYHALSDVARARFWLVLTLFFLLSAIVSLVIGHVADPGVRALSSAGRPVGNPMTMCISTSAVLSLLCLIKYYLVASNNDVWED